MKQCNVPTVQYCVEVSEPKTGLVVDRFTIEQVEVGSKAGHYDHPNYNAVQRHLSSLSEKTLLDYKIVQWGDVFDRSEWVKTGRLGG